MKLLPHDWQSAVRWVLGWVCLASMVITLCWLFSDDGQAAASDRRARERRRGAIRCQVQCLSAGATTWRYSPEEQYSTSCICSGPTMPADEVP